MHISFEVYVFQYLFSRFASLLGNMCYPTDCLVKQTISCGDGEMATGTGGGCRFLSHDPTRSCFDALCQRKGNCCCGHASPCAVGEPTASIDRDSVATTCRDAGNDATCPISSVCANAVDQHNCPANAVDKHRCPTYATSAVRQQ